MSEKNAYRLLVGEPEEKIALGKRGRRSVDNAKMDLGEIGCDDMDWIELAQDTRPVEGSCERANGPSGSRSRVAAQQAASRAVLSSIEYHGVVRL
jgi:hypothetical protein